ncbi:MAG TPA: hypothetical protein VG826_33055 [Pirellulales bacterium]|nr:hypothetical protein [Pirellulales bacterium]
MPDSSCRAVGRERVTGYQLLDSLDDFIATLAERELQQSLNM